MNDYSFEDYGIEGEGIVHRYICRKCGAEIEVSERVNSEIRLDVDDRQMTWNEYESEVKE